MRFNLLDFVLLAAIGGSVITAAMKGFTYEVFMLVATVAAIALAAWKYPLLAAHWQHGPEPHRAAGFVAFCAIAVGVLVLAMILGRLLRGLVRAAGLGLMDRLLGAGLGLIRGLLLGAALLMMLVAYPLSPRLLRESRLAPPILWISRGMAALMPSGLHARFQSGLLESNMRPGHWRMD